MVEVYFLKPLILILLPLVKNRSHILFVFLLALSVLTFSSFSLPKAKEDVKIDLPTGQAGNKSKEEKKEEVKLVEFEALVSVASSFTPVQYFNVFIKAFSIVPNVWLEFDFELKSQEFYRIFFTHIISKNAP